MTAALRLGTRRSALAVAQSTWVADRLRALGHEVEVVEIVTEGDVNSAPLTQIGGTGVFASAIRRALLAGEVDLAVHSLKDLPVEPEPGLVIAAVPEREDPRDAVVTAGAGPLEGLPDGARVGTGSPRRAAQLAASRPDLDVRPIRGNVGSRIGRVTSGDLDAVVLAAAGLARLGRSGEATPVDPETMLPAPGQGALGLECRVDRDDVVAALADLDHPATRAAVTAERALLAALEAGCTAPIGALARIAPTPAGAARDDERLELEAFAGSDDGTIALRRSAVGRRGDPVDLGRRLAEELLAAGADGLAETVRMRDDPAPSASAAAPPEAAEPLAAPRAISTDQQECPQ